MSAMDFTIYISIPLSEKNFNWHNSGSIPKGITGALNQWNVVLARCQIMNFGHTLRPKFTIMPDGFIDLLYLILSFKQSLISRNKNIYGET